VDVHDSRDRYIGTGLYNNRSLITIRLMSRRHESIDTQLISRRVQEAINYRRHFDRPDTDCRRLIFGEADRLPGIIADQFGPVVVLQNLSLGMERHLATIADTIIAAVKPETLILKNDDIIRGKEGMPLETRLYYGANTEEVLIHERGIKMHVDLGSGQKTGCFLDQKANHAYIASFSRGQRVLDCFTYIGGFALHAARAGAVSVTAVDSSQPALQFAAKNAQTNQLSGIDWVQSNAFDFLRDAVRAETQYDLIVLDPPAFAKSHSALAAATRGYKEINLSAFRLLPVGGILATHSCSFHMPESNFVETVLSAARDAKKTVRIIALRRQDYDHPVLAGYPESHYLKSLWLQVVE
jgi:23S rRNA (cytosine1962-C5)-methyltransferase